MIVNYTATDAQILATGFISERVLELSKQRFMRPSNGKGFEMQDLDITYAMSIWDAKERVALAQLIVANPGKPVHFPPTHPTIGFVPNPS